MLDEPEALKWLEPLLAGPLDTPEQRSERLVEVAAAVAALIYVLGQSDEQRAALYGAVLASIRRSGELGLVANMQESTEWLSRVEPANRMPC